MQSLTAVPREALTAEEVRDLLTRDDVTVSAGLELLGAGNVVVSDISADLDDGSVTHETRALVHGGCSLKINRALAWGRDRVRPYMILSNAAVEARFNLGVYVLTTPQTKRGESPVTYDVKGYDLLQPLATEGPGDTYLVVPADGEEIVTNPTFEAGITGWDSNPGFGAMTVATLASSVLHPTAGTKTLEATWPTGAQSWVNTHTASFVVGKTYKFEVEAWVPLDGPDAFRFEALFWAFSAWFTPVKGATNHFEWLWTATTTDVFFGMTVQSPVSGTKTWFDEFHVTAQSTTCLDAVRTVIELAGGGAPVLFDGTQQVAVLDGPMVWAIADGTEPTWLDIANDLLDAVGYESLWMDADGNYRSQPWQDPLVRPVGWTFDVGDVSTNLVGPDRTEDADVWSAPNRWKFVRRGMGVQPVDGDGIYVVNNLNRGPSSQASIGKVRRKTVFLDAVDQSSLEAQGDKIVAQDTAVTRTVTLEVDPLPIAGHLDVVQYVDGDTAAKAEVISWQVNLDGSPGRFVLEVTE